MKLHERDIEERCIEVAAGVKHCNGQSFLDYDASSKSKRRPTGVHAGYEEV